MVRCSFKLDYSQKDDCNEFVTILVLYVGGENMTLEEAISRANQGDVQCMNILGDFYGEKAFSGDGQNRSEYIDNALFWYNKAIQRGDKYAALQAINVHSFMGILYKRADEDWLADEIIEQWEEVRKCVDIVLKASDITKEEYISVQKSQRQALYEIAYGYYQKNEIGMAAIYLQSLESGSYKKADLLRGICYFQLERPINETYEFLSKLEEDEYLLLFEEMHGLELMRLSLVFFYLALIYRTGVVGSSDTDRAYAILMKGYEMVDSEAVKEMFLEELAHYKKKMFGGFTYCE